MRKQRMECSIEIYLDMVIERALEFEADIPIVRISETHEDYRKTLINQHLMAVAAQMYLLAPVAEYMRRHRDRKISALGDCMYARDGSSYLHPRMQKRHERLLKQAIKKANVDVINGKE